MFFGVRLPDNQPLWVTPAPSPHTCPVCNGRQKVPAGFYAPPCPPGVVRPSTSLPAMEEPCRTCGGSGVLWR